MFFFIFFSATFLISKFLPYQYSPLFSSSSSSFFSLVSSFVSSSNFFLILLHSSPSSFSGRNGGGGGTGYQKRNPAEELFCRDNYLSLNALQMIEQVMHTISHPSHHILYINTLYPLHPSTVSTIITSIIQHNSNSKPHPSLTMIEANQSYTLTCQQHHLLQHSCQRLFVAPVCSQLCILLALHLTYKRND
jgi:hypothetical protein